MVIIKRYPNRKLYDTEAKQYITLDGIAELIRDGQEVQIQDHATGEDLTTVTLTQIIFEQEKKQGGFLPRSVLTGLVQAGGDTLGVLRRTLASPLEMLGHVDEEIEQRVRNLVQEGEMAEEEAQHLLGKLLSRGARAVSKPLAASEEAIGQLLHKHGVPTRDDWQMLTDRLEALSAALEELETNTPPDNNSPQ
jgi:polyhydroxyalkanoate synthesis repressor PhaR